MHMLYTGARWRDCPADFGQYTTIDNCFNRWSRQGVREDIFYALTGSSAVLIVAVIIWWANWVPALRLEPRVR